MTTTDGIIANSYDAMNRIALTEGALSGGQIVQGATGETLGYNYASERIVDTLNVSGGGMQTEFYAYGEDGALDQVSIASAAFGQPVFASAYLAVVNTRDAMDRVSAYSEYASSGGSAVVGRTDVYDNDSNVTSEVDTNVISGRMTIASTTYAYDVGVISGGGVQYTGAYLGGNVTDQHTVISSGSTSSQSYTSTSDTATWYIWGDAALESTITYTPNVVSSGRTYTTLLSYDANDHIVSASIGGQCRKPSNTPTTPRARSSPRPPRSTTGRGRSTST